MNKVITFPVAGTKKSKEISTRKVCAGKLIVFPFNKTARSFNDQILAFKNKA